METQGLKRTIHPEREYSISDAARLLGVSRWTFYQYLKKYSHRLCPIQAENKMKQYVKGIQLILFRQQGFPKRGRKRN